MLRLSCAMLAALAFVRLASCQVQIARIVEGSSAASPPPPLVNPTSEAAALASLDAAAAARNRGYAGPPVLQALDGACFSKTFERYVYSFCPFHNITYKMHAALVHTKLGDFHRLRATYKADSGMHSYDTMEYSSNDKCSADATQTTLVQFVCNDRAEGGSEGGSGDAAHYYRDFQLLTMEDASNCKQLLQFSVPLPCSLLLVDAETHATLEKLHEAEEAGVAPATAKEEEERGRGEGEVAAAGECEARAALLEIEVSSLRDTIAAMHAAAQGAGGS